MPAAPAPAVLLNAERAIVRTINADRRALGLPPLIATPVLRRAAVRHSRDVFVVGSLTHASSGGTAFGARIRRVVRYRSTGETIAFTSDTQTSARGIVALWMSSPAHRAQLLSATYRRIGVGRAVGTLSGSRGLVVTADLASLD